MSDIPKKAAAFISDARQLVNHDVWHKDFSSEPYWKRWCINQLRLILSTGEALGNKAINEKAHSLTFTTMLALIPGIALVTAFLAGLGGKEYLDETLRPLILKNLIPSQGEQVFDYVNTMVTQVSFGSLGAIGMTAILWSVLSALRKIEIVFNEIMNVRRPKGQLERLPIYWSLMTLTPLLLVASGALQAAVLNSSYMKLTLDYLPFLTTLLSIVPIVMTCLAFSLLYWKMHSARIDFSSALYGGLVIGLVWEGFKAVYFVMLAKSFQLNAIYGTLAVLPATLTWVYITWMLVLVGAAMAYARQNLDVLVNLKKRPNLSRLATERLDIWLLLAIAKPFQAQQEPPTQAELARQVGLTPDLVETALGRLEDAGFLRTIDGPEVRFMPSKPVEMLNLGKVVAALRSDGDSLAEESMLLDSPGLQELFEAAEQVSIEVWEKKSIRDVLARLEIEKNEEVIAAT